MRKFQIFSIISLLLLTLILGIKEVKADGIKKPMLPTIINSGMVNPKMEYQLNNTNIKYYDIDIPELINNQDIRFYNVDNTVYVVHYSIDN